MAFKLMRKIGTAASIGLLTICSAYNAYAAPGVLPTTPIYDTNPGVEPNVFFTVDDSGSMDWEIIFKQGATAFPTDQGLPIINGNRREYLIPSWETDLVPSLAANPDTWIFRNFVANPVYYNSLIDYEPWPGYKDDAETIRMYGDADINKVREHPDDTTGTLNIKSNVSGRYLPTFCTWDGDPNGNGIEPSDPHTCVEIRPGNEAQFPSGRSYEDELQNFANWMQYFRKREYAAKHAIGTVIQATDKARMGMRLINTGHIKDLKTMTIDSNKRELMQQYYGDNASGGTPLRRRLQAVGEMFRNPGAILPQAEGGECQQNFNILMTDGYWNSSYPSGIGNEDGDNDSIFDGTGEDENVDAGNFGDEESGTLADVAMYYYENDLSPLANKVPTTAGVDLADHQHLVNYTIAFGLTGSLDPSSNPDEKGFEWPTPVSNTDTTLDDLWHAAYNSRGLFLSADNSEVMLNALLTAVADITDRETTAAAAAVTSAKLTTDTIVFLAEYNTSGWKGDILAYKITDFDTGELNSTPEWSAAQVLANRTDPANTRQIITYDNTTVKDGVPFQWSDITVEMQKDLRTSCTNATTVINPPPGSCIQQFNKYYCPVSKNYYDNDCDDGIRTGPWWNRKYYCYDPDASSTTATPGTCTSDDPEEMGIARLEYLRGSDEHEGGGYDFRQRLDSKQENRILLGDIVNSGPVYVGSPDLNIPDGGEFPSGPNAYSKFKQNQENRVGVVYAGSNDGKFHAFDERTGKEVLAYVPSYLASTQDQRGFHYLTDKRFKHMFYNDLSATVSDVYVNTGAGSGWRTVLVGGQRAGGRGYFALDVTNPGIFSENNAADIVMWEMSSNDDADLGYSYSRPQIGLMNDGSWVAIFGNGYNSSGDGKAKLFIVKLDGGVDGVWTEDIDYYKIEVGGTNGSLVDPNGLSTPALADIDGNGTIDRAYAGDLFGDMWVFDLNAGFQPTKDTADFKLFQTDAKRPITTRPILAYHPTEPMKAGVNDPNIMVYFGTGQWLVVDDKTTTDDEWFYGVWDRGEPRGEVSTTDLVQQTFRGGFDPYRVLSQEPVDYTVSDLGWKIQLDISGERSVTNPAVRGDIVLFNTTIPTTGPCSSGGYGYRFAVDIATGGTPDDPVLDINKDGKIDDEDSLGSGGDVPSADFLSSLPTDNTFTEKVGYTGKDPFAIDELMRPQIGRFSWQELLQ